MWEVVLLFSLVAGFFLGAWAFDAYTCRSRAAKMGLEYSFELSTGCMVEHKSKWIPLSSLRAVED